jgi:sterol desaturase/sphingolipid hydroxylase (fatty acid hydroxylase superfamily)
MSSEIAVRLSSASVLFVLMALWELLAPRRALTTSKPIRWFGNLTIILLNTVVVPFGFPILPVAVAVLAQKNGWGLLNLFHPPYWMAVVVGVILLDLVVYFQHVLFHAVPALFRLHMVHHADLDFDVTTGLRFHPIEIILSTAIKLAAVIVFGPPALAVLVFEVLLNATSMFNHGNIRIPLALDRLLRLFVVTPEMHRVHHSVVIKETNSNFGFNLPWWDRLFGTYHAQPRAGHERMVIGLSQFRNANRLTLPWMLALPFIGDPGQYPINRDGGRA